VNLTQQAVHNKQHEQIKLLFSFGNVAAVDKITETESINFFFLFVYDRSKENPKEFQEHGSKPFVSNHVLDS